MNSPLAYVPAPAFCFSRHQNQQGSSAAVTTIETANTNVSVADKNFRNRISILEPEWPKVMAVDLHHRDLCNSHSRLIEPLTKTPTQIRIAQDDKRSPHSALPLFINDYGSNAGIQLGKQEY